jgi:hypothetical protein
MDKTRIYVTKDLAEARQKAQQWIIDKETHRGAVVSEATTIVVKDPANAFGSLWSTPADDDGPWYVVLATPNNFASDSGVSSLAGPAASPPAEGD